MIPVLLQLKNFLSYGEDVPPLDFTEFDVACLTGENGHGKSALLDAMTWALWGEARKAVGEKSAADGLLRIGTTEMHVEFVFDLDADRYRILRKYHRKKGKRGTPTLEFQIFDEQSKSYRPLSERASKKTQEKINATLRMTYETFINSAFILQGHVDEFTKRNPSQRKAILAEILDLSRYESLRNLTRDHLRDTEKEQAVLTQQLTTMAEELRHKSAYELALNELRQKLTALNEQLQAAETRHQTLVQQRTELQGKQQQLEEKQRQHTRLKQDVKHLKQRIQRQEENIAENAGILDRETEVQAQYQRYQQLREHETAHEDKRRSHAQYQAQCTPLEKAITDARHTLEKEREKKQAERDQVQRLVDETQQQLNHAQDIETGYRELCAGRGQDEELESLRIRADELGQAIREVENHIAAKKNNLDIDVKALQRQIDDVQTQTGKQAEHERQVADLRQEITRLESLEQELTLKKEEGVQCRTELDGLKARRKANVSEEQETHERADLLKRSRQPQCPLCQSDLDEHKEHEIEEHFQQKIDGLTLERDQLDVDIRQHESHRNQLLKAYKQLESQLKQLPTTRRQLADAEHAVQLGRQAAEQLQTLQVKADVLTTTLNKKDYAPEAHRQLAALQQQQSDVRYDAKAHQALKKQLKTLQHFDGDYSKLEDTRTRHDKAAARLPDIHSAITEIQAQLEQQTYARTEQNALHDIRAQIDTLGYNADEHERIRQELHQLQHAPTQKAQVDQARKAAQELEHTHAELLEERQHKTEQLAELERMLTELQQQLEEFGSIEQHLRMQEDVLKTLRVDRDDLLQRQGTFQSKLEHCLKVEQQQRLEQERKSQVDKDGVLYGHLNKIFGKDGIQAYLIENAMPEIEEEANAILSRLTDNRTSIAIESIKNSQSGGTRETLDIKISDELGTRSYEMYSGGEAFRVDFSIRVALSKLLATRAGTQLKTLVIDEGFGTQDTRGLEQLVQAITEISKDFEKILVITHIEALKDAFPVKIEVVKQPDTGSQYQIIH